MSASFHKEVHKDKLLKIPRPCPVVLYTGRDGGKNAMELEVLVLNITPGHNNALLQRSPRLCGYMAFITRLREHEKTMPRMEAVLATLDWCIACDILADFFREHRKEVSNMILNELTNEDALQTAREEERQQAIDLINQGLTSEQLKQALLRESLRVVPQTTKTESSKR